MADTDPKSTVKIALISAGASIVTALITAVVTISTSLSAANKSAERANLAAVQAESVAHALVPSGAVLALTSSCPKGWLPYDAGKGRFVVGANDQYPIATRGGSAKIAFEFVQRSQPVPANVTSDRFSASFLPSSVVRALGSDPPLLSRIVSVPTEPPYIALNLCIRP